MTTSNNSDNKPTLSIAVGGTVIPTSSPEDLVIGAWYHLTAMREGSFIKLYVNGVLKATTNIGSSAINNTGLNMVIGKALSGLYTNAAYDDLYIYNRALTEEEVRYLYLDKPELMVNKYLNNGGTEYNGTAGWYDLMYRGYDPVLGRMNQVDPKADKYPSITPYNFSMNNPVMLNDPMGDDVISISTGLYVQIMKALYFGTGKRTEVRLSGSAPIMDYGTYGGGGGLSASGTWQPSVVMDGKVANPRGKDGIRQFTDQLTLNIFMGAINGYVLADGISVGGQSLTSFDQNSRDEYGWCDNETASYDYSTQNIVGTADGILATDSTVVIYASELLF